MLVKTTTIWILFIFNKSLISAFLMCTQYEKQNLLKLVFRGPFFPEISENDIQYHLYTRQNPTEPIVLKSNSSIKYFDKGSPIKIIIHGWIEHGKIDWYLAMIQAYLSQSNYNIIAIDWSRGANPNYVSATFNVANTGKYVGSFLFYLFERYNISPKEIHVIGHSLGAHVAGIAGKVVEIVSGVKIGRITALDPARPLYEIPLTCPNNRLIESDGDFVDVVHTDAGLFGFKSPVGKVDFYPNGGSAFQPGCHNITRLADIFCSHKRSHTYFIESILSKPIRAQHCDSWDSYQKGYCSKNRLTTFGEHASDDASGSYFFQTREDCPFIKND